MKATSPVDRVIERAYKTLLQAAKGLGLSVAIFQDKVPFIYRISKRGRALGEITVNVVDGEPAYYAAVVTSDDGRWNQKFGAEQEAHSIGAALRLINDADKNEERTMGDMRAILEAAEVDRILREAAEDTACASKYMDPKTGRFKGGKGERFDNCVKMMQCKGGVDDPEALCAKIARAKGLAPGGKKEDLDEAVGANLVTRMAEAMLGAPKLEVLMTRVFDDESQANLFAGMIQGPLEALIAKALDAAGATVSGGVLSKSTREMRGAARGDLSAE